MKGNIFAGILEGLGKAMMGYGTSQMEQENKKELVKMGVNPFLDVAAQMFSGQNNIKPQANSNLPNVGDVVDGYKFLGGDPSQPSSWQQVR